MKQNKIKAEKNKSAKKTPQNVMADWFKTGEKQNESTNMEEENMSTTSSTEDIINKTQNKKVKKIGLFHALSQKNKSKLLHVVEDFKTEKKYTDKIINYNK